MDLMLNSWMMNILISDHPLALLAQTAGKTVKKAATTAPVKSTNWIVAALVTLVITAIAFYLISLIPGIGIEIDGVVTAIICAVVFGALNVISQPLENLLNITWLLSPIALLINMVVFWVTDILVGGFRITNGIIGIALGSIALTIVQALIRKLIEVVI